MIKADGLLGAQGNKRERGAEGFDSSPLGSPVARFERLPEQAPLPPFLRMATRC